MFEKTMHMVGGGGEQQFALQLTSAMRDLASRLFALAAACLAMLAVAAIFKRRHRHRTFERMQVPGPEPHLIHGHLYETRRQPYVKFAHKMHEKYGKNVGIYLGGDPYLMTKDLDLIQQVFVAKSRLFYDRMDFYLNIDPVPDNLICQRGDRWRYMRKLLTPAFSNSKIRSSHFYSDTLQTVGKFERQLEENSSLVKQPDGQLRRETFLEDSYDRMAAVALDVIVKTAFHMDNVISFNGPVSGYTTSNGQRPMMRVGKPAEMSSKQQVVAPPKQDAFLNTVKRACRLAFNPLVELIFCFPFLDVPLTFLCNQFYLGSIIALLYDRLEFLVRRSNYPTTNRAASQSNSIKQNSTNKKQQSSDEAAAKQTSGSGGGGAPQNRRRIIDSLIEVLREKRITRSEFTGNAFVIVFAGFETTANALTFTLWLLAKHERVQRKLRQELRSQLDKLADSSAAAANNTANSRQDNNNDADHGVASANDYGDYDDAATTTTNTAHSNKQTAKQQNSKLPPVHDEIRLAELAIGCEYLEMVLNESLRLYPPVPGLSCRQASVECQLPNGLIIEKGVNVIPSVFSIQRDRSIWGADANEFRPERFEVLDVAQLNSAMFMPFGLGPRNCIGKALAMHEMKIVIGRLVLGYTIESVPGWTPDKVKLCSPINITITSADKIGLKFVKL